MVEVELEVVGHRVLGVGNQVVAWHSEELGLGWCIGGWSTLAPLVIGSEVGRMLWWRLVTLKGIDMFNGRWAIVTFSRCVPLHTTGLTDGVYLNC